MEKFEHKLRTTVHTRSVQQIMTRNQPFFTRTHQFKLSHPKLDNITTYLRKFQIDRENLNLAKRIMQCESQHSRDRYGKQWKKVKKFLRVRSNFKPQLSAKSPKIYKFSEISGHGRLMVKIVFQSIQSNMKQLSSNSLYMMKFNLGGSQLVPNKQFFTLDTSQGYTCQFLAPMFLRGKSISVRLIKVIENNMFQAGRFSVSFSEQQLQICDIHSKMGKVVGKVNFTIKTELLQKQNKSITMVENKQNKQNKQNISKRSNRTNIDQIKSLS